MTAYKAGFFFFSIKNPFFLKTGVDDPKHVEMF